MDLVLLVFDAIAWTVLGATTHASLAVIRREPTARVISRWFYRPTGNAVVHLAGAVVLGSVFSLLLWAVLFLKWYGWFAPIMIGACASYRVVKVIDNGGLIIFGPVALVFLNIGLWRSQLG
jgi:hypothetical protein